MNRITTADHLSAMLTKSRKDAGQTQKYMAKALGKSLGTISNWEMGIGAPNLLDTIEWFDVLNLNFISYWVNFMEEKPELILTKSQSNKILQCITLANENDFDEILDTMVLLSNLSKRDRVIAAKVIHEMYITM